MGAPHHGLVNNNENTTAAWAAMCQARGLSAGKPLILLKLRMTRGDDAAQRAVPRTIGKQRNNNQEQDLWELKSRA
jgi:hypothetical protein